MLHLYLLHIILITSCLTHPLPLSSFLSVLYLFSFGFLFPSSAPAFYFMRKIENLITYT